MSDIQVGHTREPGKTGALNIKGKQPGMFYRWVRKDRVEERQDAGWVVVKGKNKIQRLGKTESSVSSVVKHRELVLMKVPQEHIDERNRQLAARNRKIEEATKRQYLQSGKMKHKGKAYDMKATVEEKDEDID